MISSRNFTNVAVTELPADDEYELCNFTQRVPDTSGANPKGVRLWPGDDTPRTFRNCNLTNCEVPPGSTIIDSNTDIIVFDIVSHTDDIVIDSVVVDSTTYHNYAHHGRFNPETGLNEYKSVPDVYPQDY